MKKFFLFAVCGSMTAILTGCSSLKSTSTLNDQALVEKGETIAHINGRVSGFYMFGFIPIWCGSSNDVGQPTFFNNNVKLTGTVDMVTRESKRLNGSKLIDMQSSITERPAIPIFPAFIMSIRECQVSGNCVK